MRRRVVITGVGAVTPVGLSARESWQSLLEGKGGIGPITRFDASELPCSMAGELKGFDPTRWLSPRELRATDPFTQYAIAAAAMAMADAGLGKFDGEAAERAGCYLGVGLGGMTTLERTVTSMRERGMRHGISAYAVAQVISNLAPGQIAIRFCAKGPNMAHASACASSAHAIGEAMRVIRDDLCDVMIAGGAEATLSPLALGAFAAMRALSPRQAPEASCPFDRRRDGFVMGEGSAVLVLEEREHALARGARIYAEVAGYGLSADATHLTAPAPEGEGAQRAMKMALRDARMDASEVGYVNAHGTSTPLGDALETHAIKRVFGDRASSLPVSSTKSATGHLLGAAGAVEALFCALALSEGAVPPTLHLHEPDPACDLDYVPHEARQLAIRAALSNSFGFGGTNASLVFAQA